MTGSAWGQRRVGQEGLPEIFIAPVFLDLSSPGFMRSVAVACYMRERDLSFQELTDSDS